VARHFFINPSLQNAKSVRVGDLVALELFEGKSYTAKVVKAGTSANGNFTLTLRLPDYPLGYAMVTTSNRGRSLVSISIPELGLRFGSRFNTTFNECYLIEIDERKVEYIHSVNDALMIPKSIELSGSDRTNSPIAARAPAPPNPFDNPNVEATISLLVVYTPEVARSSYVRVRGGIENAIEEMIAYGNIALSNSLTGITLTLAHAAQVSYIEDGDMYNALGRLQNPNDGYMDEVHEMRRQYQADLVQLLVTDSNWGGLAFGLQTTAGMYEWGFSTVLISQADQTSIHEIGHNLGLGHGANMIDAPLHCLFDYSYGWDWTGTSLNPRNTNQYCSVMSYESGNYYTDRVPRYRVPYFSNPDVVHQGQPTGNAARADAARSLREIKHIVAFYSDRAAPFPSKPKNIVVSNPTVNGATFSWDDCTNAVGYRLRGKHTDGQGYFWSFSESSFTLSYSPFFQPCTAYEVWVSAFNEYNIEGHSELITFKTRCTTDPTVTTSAATSITGVGATLNKAVTEHGSPVTLQGFRYKTDSETSWRNSADGILTGLTINTAYKFYAYAETGYGRFNGSVLTFTANDPPLTDLATAKSMVEGTTFAPIPQTTHNTETASKTYIESIVQALGFSGVSTTVSTVSFQQAAMGDDNIPAGVNGNYTFTVTLDNGIEEIVTTRALTLVITATSYNPASLPLFDGLEGDIFEGAPAVVLKLKGRNSARFNSFKVNGTPATTFNPNAKGKYLIEAVAPDGTRIETYIIVK